MAQGLKLIMACSEDGIVSLAPDDDMSWTGTDDKRAFRLLTSVGGVLGAGRRTFEQLPTLKGRRTYCLSSRRGVVMNAAAREAMQFPFSDGPVSDDAAYEETLTLGQFAHRFPEAWLIGGQTVALEALQLQMVGEVFLCRAPIELHYSTLYDPRTAQLDRITPTLKASGRWSQTDTVRVGDTRVEVWRKKP